MCVCLSRSGLLAHVRLCCSLCSASLGKQARVSASVGLGFAAVLSTSFALLTVTFRGYIVRAFSDDGDVRSLTAECILVVALLLIFDAINGVTTSILKAVGRQSWSAWSNFLSFYVIGTVECSCLCTLCALTSLPSCSQVCLWRTCWASPCSGVSLVSGPA